MTNRPLILGHRGARKYAPENSIPAFRKAIEMRLDGVEFDVMSTMDGLPIVIHDDNLARLTGHHIHIHKTPYADIEEIDIGKYFDPYFAGENIPTLKETLELFSGTNFFINIELKAQPRQNKNFIGRVIEIIEGSRFKSQILVSSFKRNLLYKIGRLAPDIKRGLLLHPKPFFFLDVIFFGNILAVHGLNPHISNLDQRLMKYARDRSLKVFVWAVNEPNDVKKAVNLEVDGIITDEPVLVKEMIKEIYG